MGIFRLPVAEGETTYFLIHLVALNSSDAIYFSFDPKSSLLLVFVLHALVFSVLLVVQARQSEHRPSFWLSAFTFLSGLYIAPFMLGYAGWYSQQPYRDILFYIPFQQLLLLPPVLYLYVKTLLNPAYTLSPKDRLHFLPGLSYGLYSLTVFVTDKLICDDPYFYADGRDKDFAPWYQLAGFSSLLLYSLLSLRVYFRYKAISYQTVSFADAIRFDWVKRFLMALLILLLLRGVFFLVNPEWDQFGRKFWYYLCFSGLFYYISISGYGNALQSILSLKAALVLGQHAESIRHQPDNPVKSVASDELDEIDLNCWKRALEQVMTREKAYQNPTLTLLDMAQLMGISTKRVSQIINQGFGMNFNDFVNEYRTQAVINQMQQGNHTVYTLLGIAYECGFNSKSTFNRAFKKHTGRSPRQYVAQNEP